MGSDPAAAWRTAEAQMREVLAATDPDLIVPVHHGDATVEEVLAMAVVEPLIHTWDLAQAAGIPVTFDQETIEVCLTAITPIAERFATTGMYAPSLPVSEEATPEQRLLALLGRQAAA